MTFVQEYDPDLKCKVVEVVQALHLRSSLSARQKPNVLILICLHYLCHMYVYHILILDRRKKFSAEFKMRKNNTGTHHGGSGTLFI